MYFTLNLQTGFVKSKIIVDGELKERKWPRITVSPRKPQQLKQEYSNWDTGIGKGVGEGE